jgi:hypothetical protein
MRKTTYVYIVEGLGFGDDESAWERSSVHTTREGPTGADAERARLLEACGLDATDVRVVEEEVR